ncbi:MAG: tRNA uridine-5-carboxymethylaminomethyl(34) synthesis GTPase MnmE [Desulfobulbaceae bacterium A2]|nr:MAG: tRNA uridine-5-carboxymethylaminomethyl(34) synthesis GTPase MnmE [Desulfobulbaceae bacterium A2]
MPLHLLEGDTIAAIATPPGAGGIGIVRVSGPQSCAILTRLFTPSRPRADFPSHLLVHGTVHTLRGVPLDEVLAVFMRAPHSYTREDVVEFQCHGGFQVLQAVLGEILAAGARPALAGEFTRRAFLNGRLDLTQAEAVIDLIEARGGIGARMALAQLQGQLGRELEGIRQSLLGLLAQAEVAIDFPEEEQEILAAPAALALLEREVLAPLARLLARGESGRLWRDGAEVVIAGRPNVGKSSLLNALLREDRALVTPVAGTTRDTIEEYLRIEGMPVRLVDTAGLRDEAGTIEGLGIERARRKASGADLVLLMIDGSVPPCEEDHRIRDELSGRPLLLVCNKGDLPPACSDAEYAVVFPGLTPLRISAREQSGLDELRRAIFSQLVHDRNLDPEGNCAPNLRHRQALAQALREAQALAAALADGLTIDLVALELRLVLASLDEILGSGADEDLLDTIFSRFCLGK